MLRQKRVLNDPRVADPALSVETGSRLRGLSTKGECCRGQRAEHRHSDSPWAECHRRKSVWRNRDTRNGCIRERGTIRGCENRRVGTIGPCVARKLIQADRPACFGTRERPLTAIENSDMADAVEGRTKTLCLSVIVRTWVFGLSVPKTIGNTVQAVSAGCFPRSSERPLADPPLGPLPGMRCGRVSREWRPRPRPLRTVHRSSRSNIGCAGRPTRSASRRYGHLARAVLGSVSPIRGSCTVGPPLGRYRVLTRLTSRDYVNQGHATQTAANHDCGICTGSRNLSCTQL